MTALTREEVTSAIGSVEDHYAAQIIGTGASLEEFTEARSWLVNDEAPMNAGQPLPSGRVAQLLGIMRKAEDSLLSDSLD
jgi:hypothetical protein